MDILSFEVSTKLGQGQSFHLKEPAQRRDILPRPHLYRRDGAGVLIELAVAADEGEVGIPGGGVEDRVVRSGRADVAGDRVDRLAEGVALRPLFRMISFALLVDEVLLALSCG